ncbi:hypothetical protein Ahy_B03g064766 [Arachis hypogaea]|uniref:Uncharacterized protein n=1 Tax=Arachis hypogaea TaxID=3818 RepID=A0A445A0B1_ARAHY|nr:hypothetical protein Ahy_B03g064766 [Arachis hypogaea]
MHVRTVSGSFSHQLLQMPFLRLLSVNVIVKLLHKHIRLSVKTWDTFTEQKRICFLDNSVPLNCVPLNGRNMIGKADESGSPS